MKLGGIFKEENTMFNINNKYKQQDTIAMKIAQRYGLTSEYKAARSHGLSPIEALEDWDMMTPEDYKLFEE